METRMMSTTEGELELEVANDREDGEIEDSDVEEGTYVPLQRPESFNPPSLVHMQIQDDPSDEGSPEVSSASDSDSELRKRPKRTKLRVKKPQAQAQHDPKKNKYNIWCTALQEDLLAEDMVGCDVTKTRRYGVESYDYTIKYRLGDESNVKQPFVNTTDNNKIFSNKRSYGDRKNAKLRLGHKPNSQNKHDSKQKPRLLAELIINSEDSVEDVAKDIAEKLNEEKSDLIEKIVQLLGNKKAIELYDKTKSIEADGGMLVMNGTRRRTPGGIYFFLLKRDDDISQNKVNKIFNDDRKETHKKIKRMKAKSRQTVVEQLKQSLTDSELPSLLSRGEATVTRTEHGSNPPPSPATDAKDYSSDTDGHSHTETQSHSPPADPRAIRSYEDGDYLEVMCNDDMDLF